MGPDDVDPLLSGLGNREVFKQLETDRLSEIYQREKIKDLQTDFHWHEFEETV